MLKIHHLVLSRSERIVWLAEELGIQYELVRHTRDPQTFRATDSLRAIMPLGKAPVVQDGDVTIAESAVIIDYILDRHGNGRLRPAAGTQEDLDYRYWMHCSESTLMYPVLIDLLSSLTQSDAPGLQAFAGGEYATMFGYVDQMLARRDHIASRDFTAADIMVYYTLALGAGTAIAGFQTHAPMAEYPRIGAYLERLQERPAFRKSAELCK